MMKMRRLLSVILLVCLMVTLLPAGAVTVHAESLEPDENGVIYFTTFEELKTICSRTYEEQDYVAAFYDSEKELVIKENLTISDYLSVYLFNAGMKVSKGATLTVPETAWMYVQDFTVEGTANVSSMYVAGKITLTGQMSVGEYVSASLAADHKGLEKITFTSDYGYLSLEGYFASTAELMELVDQAAAYQGTKGSWDFLFIMDNEDVVINKSVTIPSNCSLVAYPMDEVVHTLTLAKGCTLTNDGGITLQLPCYVEGTLVNNGSIFITRDEQYDYAQGMLTINGKYSGEGIIGVESTTLSGPQEAVKGLDLSGYTVEDYGGEGYHYWVCHLGSNEEPNQPQPDTGITRLAGNTRYATAIAAADQLKKLYGVDKFENIIVSSGEEFADALAGSYLAAVKGAPILLVKDSTVKMVKEYIQKNLVSGGTVYLLGGEKAVPKSMESGLDGFNVKRLGGNTRYETNLLILQEAGLHGLDIIVCTGKSFADSLSASAVGLPILLVKDGLTAEQKDFLKAANANYFIIGGKNAVTETVEKQLKNYGEIHRIAGDTRYKTSVMVAQFFAGSNQHAVLAYGDNFPDGLAGGPLAYALGAPLLLTKPGREADAADFIASRGISSGYVMGGTAVLPDKTVNKVFGVK